MEREAFARAWRYLNHKPVAKWGALASAVASGILYVAFLVILLLFAALMVERGKIPAYRDLPEAEQAEVQQNWGFLSWGDFLAQDWTPLDVPQRVDRLKAVGVDERRATELANANAGGLLDRDQLLLYRTYRDPELQQRADLLRAVGVEDKRAAELAGANPQSISPRDREIIWRAQLYQLLRDRVGPDAAQTVVFDKEPSDENLANRGILSLVVRRRDYPSSGRLVGWLARVCPWMWDAGATTYLTGLLLIALALALLRALAMFATDYLAALAVIEACNRLRRAVYHHSFRMGAMILGRQGAGEAVSTYTRQIESIHDGLYTWITVVCREPVKFVLLLVFALILDFWLALAFLIFAVLVWLIGGRLAVYFRRQEREADRQSAEQLALLQESSSLMRLVKAYAMELFNQSRVERQLAVHGRAQGRRYFGESVYRPLLIFLGTVAGLVLLYVAGWKVLRGSLNVPAGIALATALVSLYWPLVNLLERRRFLRRAGEAAVVIFKFLDKPGEVGQAVGAEFLPPMSRQLVFDKVTLKEPGTERKLLDNVSLTVKAGQRVALVGPDEMEKQALIYLIPRFLDPTSGEVRIDDHNLRWVTFESLRAQVALVLQNQLVFNDTVANNIGCGDPAFTLPKIIEAAKVAHAHHFIQKLPQGYETVVGEMGHTLGVSEQFRIALARAILRDPALLVIEEPAVALDDDTKDLLDDTFNRVLPGRTVIFMPHRMSTIRSCEQVFLLNKGQVEATGDHRELLSSNQLYRHLQYMEFNEFAERRQ